MLEIKDNVKLIIPIINMPIKITTNLKFSLCTKDLNLKNRLFTKASFTKIKNDWLDTAILIKKMSEERMNFLFEGFCKGFDSYNLKITIFVYLDYSTAGKVSSISAVYKFNFGDGIERSLHRERNKTIGYCCTNIVDGKIPKAEEMSDSFNRFLEYIKGLDLYIRFSFDDRISMVISKNKYLNKVFNIIKIIILRRESPKRYPKKITENHRNHQYVIQRLAESCNESNLLNLELDLFTEYRIYCDKVMWSTNSIQNAHSHLIYTYSELFSTHTIKNILYSLIECEILNSIVKELDIQEDISNDDLKEIFKISHMASY